MKKKYFVLFASALVAAVSVAVYADSGKNQLREQFLGELREINLDLIEKRQAIKDVQEHIRQIRMGSRDTHQDYPDLGANCDQSCRPETSACSEAMFKKMLGVAPSQPLELDYRLLTRAQSSC